MTGALISQRSGSDRCLLCGDVHFDGDQPSHHSDRACSCGHAPVEHFNRSSRVLPANERSRLDRALAAPGPFSFQPPCFQNDIALRCAPQVEPAHFLTPMQCIVAVTADRTDVHQALIAERLVGLVTKLKIIAPRGAADVAALGKLLFR